MDPNGRSSASELLNHTYFNRIRDQLENETNEKSSQDSKVVIAEVDPASNAKTKKDECEAKRKQTTKNEPITPSESDTRACKNLDISLDGMSLIKPKPQRVPGGILPEQPSLNETSHHQFARAGQWNSSPVKQPTNELRPPQPIKSGQRGKNVRKYSKHQHCQVMLSNTVT